MSFILKQQLRLLSKWPRNFGILSFVIGFIIEFIDSIFLADLLRSLVVEFHYVNDLTDECHVCYLLMAIVIVNRKFKVDFFF